MSPPRKDKGDSAEREEGKGLLGGNTERQEDWGECEDNRGKALQGDSVTGLKMSSSNLG